MSLSSGLPEGGGNEEEGDPDDGGLLLLELELEVLVVLDLLPVTGGGTAGTGLDDGLPPPLVGVMVRGRGELELVGVGPPP